MIINFVGTFNQSGYVGEISDETHLANELENLGHTVRRIARDVWREWVLGNYKVRPPEIPENLKADINLIAKWHHFFDGGFIKALRTQSGPAPVFYWVWDYMDDQGIPEWHMEMAKEADLYLSGELGNFDKYKKEGVRPYYFQFDACDGELPVFMGEKKSYDVIFTGSCIGQGHRREWLTKINEQVKVKIFGWGYEEWRNLGFDAEPPVYGEDYNRLIARSRIVLGFSVEPNCWGYWSNRVGKVIRAGGFLLQEYAPGMEQFLPIGAVKYFNSPEEAIELIYYYLSSREHTDRKSEVAQKFAHNFTSKKKVMQLAVLMDRYLKGDPKQWLL